MRRHVLQATGLAVAVALALTACGGTEETGSQSGAAATRDAVFPRTVEHAMGETEIPQRPERVVVLDTGELDSVLSLGVTPVGAVTTAVSAELPQLPRRGRRGRRAGRHDRRAEPGGDRRPAAGPDPVEQGPPRGHLRQLSQIAPTVFAERVGAAWKDNFRLAAQALGLEDEAATALAEYERDAAALGESIGDPAGTTVSPLRFVAGTIRAYQPESFIGTVLADIGLDQVELPTGEVATFAELAAEELTVADADIVLHSSYGPADGVRSRRPCSAGPLWPRLGAVQGGRDYAVEDDVFFTGIGLTAARLIVEDLTDQLAG